jgi:hypothetical protein
MDDLARIGLVGTARHALAGVVDGEHPVDGVVAALRIGDRERLFLLNAGARAVFEQCGHIAANGYSPPSPSPPETLPWASQKVVGLLQQAMDADSSALLVELLGHLKTIGRLLPPEVLPHVLPTKSREIREKLRPVLGERGRWLAQLNPEWRWAADGLVGDSDVDRGSLSRQWEEGSIDERCRVIEVLRRTDPSEARRWVEEAIGKEKADHRVRLVETLAIGLGSEDESLLESLLDDRSEQVRRAAAASLARVSGSALAKRMVERACGMLSAQKRGILRRSLRLVCHAPEEIDAAWVRDGIPAKPPPGRGKRAVWTEAVLAAVPPRLWCDQFGLTPAELIQAIAQDEFADAALVGWTRAATAFAECDAACAAWLCPLAEYWLSAVCGKQDKASSDALERLQALLPKMPAAEAEAVLLGTLRRASSGQVAGAASLLTTLPHPWSRTFSVEYLAAVRSVLLQPASLGAYPWLSTLKLAGYAFPRDSFAAAMEPWRLADAPKDEYAAQAIGREIDAFIETIRIRQSFYNDVRDDKSPSPAQANS